MRHHIQLAVAGLVAVAAFGAPAHAEKGPAMFERADKDGDGFVSKLEFTDSRASVFQKIDANGDGALDRDELMKARAAYRQGGVQPPAEGQTQPEAQTPPQGGPPHGFMKRADANGDGLITTAEFGEAGEKMFAMLDKNGDGKLAKDEMHRRRMLEQGEPPVQ